MNRSSSRDLCTLFGSDRYAAAEVLRTAGGAILSILLTLAAVLAVLLLTLFALPLAVCMVALAGGPARGRRTSTRLPIGNGSLADWQQRQFEADGACEQGSAPQTERALSAEESREEGKREAGRPGDGAKTSSVVHDSLPERAAERGIHAAHATTLPCLAATAVLPIGNSAQQEAIDRRAVEWAEEETALEAAAEWALDRAALEEAGFVLHAPAAPSGDRSPASPAPVALAPPPVRPTAMSQATSDKPIDKEVTPPTAQALSYPECAVLTVAQLRKAAAAYGVRGTRTMRKAGLLAALFPHSRPGG